jgi:CHAT domain-containing protein
VPKGDPRAFFPTTPPSDLCAAEAKTWQAQPVPETGETAKLLAADYGGSATGAADRTGSDFTAAYITRAGGDGGELDSYRVIFFGTHGVLPSDNDDCLKAGLLTSASADSPLAFLDTDAITKLHLQADLVVLAACNTGRNTDSGSGADALGGLVQSFEEAGARNVLVSNWEVSASATQELMKDMFAHVHDGSSQAAALAAAERTVRDLPGRSNPFFWAPFMVVGDGAKPMPS